MPLRQNAPADPKTYLKEVAGLCAVPWPRNRTVTIVCHGHSVPAGYFATPHVATFDAYPHLWHRAIKERFPNAVVNVVVTAIGGEHSESGAARFAADVLGLRPDVVTIDYALNDRRVGLEPARRAWAAMLDAAAAARTRSNVPPRVLLLTPTPDVTQRPDAPEADRKPLREHADQVRALAAEYRVGLVDSLAAFDLAVAETGRPLGDFLSQSNHPNRRGHDLVAAELARWLPGG